MRPTIRSLNAKLLLIVIGFVILSGILGAVRVGFAETRRIQTLYDNRLLSLSSRYSHYLEDELQARADTLLGARDVLLEALSQPRVLEPDLREYRDADGAYRKMDRYSGVFVHRDQPIDARINQLAHASQLAWERVTPVVDGAFSAFYFISRERVSRVWPQTIAINHRPDHDVTTEIFYTIATPEQNPQRAPQWTPIYFDAYSGEWMTSLIVPVYEQDDFVGVIGGDINVSYLLGKLSDLDTDGDQIMALIYDDEGQLVIHSAQRPDVGQRSEDYPLLNAPGEPEVGAADYMAGVAAGSVSLGEVARASIDGKPVHVVANRLDKMEWFISFYYPHSLIETRFRESMISVYINIILLAVFLFVVLFFSIRRYVVRRISALADATSRIDRENWYMSVPDSGSDEIARLGKSINNMLDQIRHLVRGLDDKISLLDKASLESRRLMSAIENSASLVVILNRDWKIEYANSQYWQTTGFSADDDCTRYRPLLLDENNSEKITLEDIDRKLQSQLARGGNIEDSAKWQAEYLATTASGQHFWLMQTVTAILGNDQRPDYYVCVGQDITDLKEKQQEVEKLAYYDHLTGLANRTLFKSQLRATLNRCLRTGHKMALFYLDLDHFKRINDTFGHEDGDLLLIEVARRLTECLRQEDMVARLGGDEFAVMLDEVESPQYAYVVANKIIQALNHPVELHGKEVVPGVSIGITIAPDDSNELDVLMKSADLAMYQAKDKGRNSFQFYTADMNLAVEQRLTIERELRQALRFGQFELYYQPLIDLGTEKIVGAEALVRWNHPVHGMVSPADFIPAAEESGLIVPLGKWVLKTACYQTKGIQKALARDFKISVNLSARQLNEPDFITTLERCLRETGLAAASLELEVTESTLMVDAENVIPRLEQLRQKGCSLAIDDFGTGYSSLSYLKRLPINSLKVDRSFVKDLPEDEEDRAITSLIVAMANSLHYKVVVEGVETKEQHEFLSGCGCHYGQGFLYSRPLPADHFIALLFADDND